MPTVREIVVGQPVERVRQILAASPRRFREEIFRRLGVKQRSAGSSFRLSGSDDGKAKKLVEVLSVRDDAPEDILSELIRNYLYTRRGLLGDALDFFDIEHREGLTDSDLDFLADLESARIVELRSALAQRGHSEEDVDLYVGFMNIGGRTGS